MKEYEVSYTLDMGHIKTVVVTASKKVEAMVDVMVRYGKKCIVTDIREKCEKISELLEGV
jgi:hypothetical protein